MTVPSALEATSAAAVKLLAAMCGTADHCSVAASTPTALLHSAVMSRVWWPSLQTCHSCPPRVGVEAGKLCSMHHSAPAPAHTSGLHTASANAAWHRRSRTGDAGALLEVAADTSVASCFAVLHIMLFATSAAVHEDFGTKSVVVN